jgi:8-oxo-dGTP pyrophosphatase MutT (NUDIX family)
MAHNNYYLDLCVDTYVVHEGAVLLRLHEKYDFWGAPGGHIDAGEDVNEAALREVWEEVGLRVELVGPRGWVRHDTDFNKDLVPPVCVNRHNITETHAHSAFIFVARAESREVRPQSAEDVHAQAPCVWVTRIELDTMKENDARLSKDAYRYACLALDLLGS